MGEPLAWLTRLNWITAGNIRSRRDLILGVGRVTLLVVLAADLIDLAINWLVEPEIIIRSAVQTTFTAALMSSIFIGSIAKANLDLFVAKAKLETLSRTDAQTGLLNRRSFFEAADARKVDASPAYLLVLDIDHFKAVNDAYGHPTGDTVLDRVGALIRQVFPEPQITGRVGGEEFAILLFVPSMLDAEMQAGFFRRRVEAEPFCVDGMSFSVTVSVGISALVGERPLGEAYKLADTALYEAKHGGRNRVAISGPRRASSNLAIVASR